MQLVRAFAVFLIAGPLIGAIPFAALFFALGVRDPIGPGLGFMPLILAYPIGIVPAAIAGAIYPTALARLNGAPSTSKLNIVFIGALCGLAGSVPLITLLMAFLPRIDVRLLSLPVLLVGIPAIISGGACALLALDGGTPIKRVFRWLMSERLQIAVLVAVLFSALIVLVRGTLAA